LGVTRNAVHRSGGMRPASRAMSARSDQLKRARPTWRRRTASWRRSTRISASLAIVSLLTNPRSPKCDRPGGRRRRAPRRAASPTRSWLVKALAGSFWTLQGEFVAAELFVALVVGRGAPVAGVRVHHQGGAGGPQRQGEVLWRPMRVGRVDHAVAVSAVEGHDTCAAPSTVASPLGAGLSRPSMRSSTPC